MMNFKAIENDRVNEIANDFNEEFKFEFSIAHGRSIKDTL